MSVIEIPYSDDFPLILNAKVYDLEESIAASKYPFQVHPDPEKTNLTETAIKLAQSKPGSGHDNWLNGVCVSFDLKFTAKALIELERYHFMNIVSCNSTMHRIVNFDLDTAYCEYVDPRIISVMKELVCKYNESLSDEDYLRVLYSNPAGFIYTLRIQTNYRQLKTVFGQRRYHLIPEWRQLCKWSRELLPMSYLITGAFEDDKQDD